MQLHRNKPKTGGKVSLTSIAITSLRITTICNISSVVHISTMGTVMADSHRNQVGLRLIVLAGECRIVGKEVGWRIMGGVGEWGMVLSSGCEW